MKLLKSGFIGVVDKHKPARLRVLGAAVTHHETDVTERSGKRTRASSLGMCLAPCNISAEIGYGAPARLQCPFPSVLTIWTSGLTQVSLAGL